MAFPQSLFKAGVGPAAKGILTGIIDLRQREEQRRGQYEQTYWQWARMMTNIYDDLLRSDKITDESRQSIESFIFDLSSPKFPEYKSFWNKLGIGMDYTITSLDFPDAPTIDYKEEERTPDTDSLRRRLNDLHTQYRQYMAEANDAPTYDMHKSIIEMANTLLPEIDSIRSAIVEGPVEPLSPLSPTPKAGWKPPYERRATKETKEKEPPIMPKSDELAYDQLKRQLGETRKELSRKRNEFKAMKEMAEDAKTLARTAGFAKKSPEEQEEILAPARSELVIIQEIEILLSKEKDIKAKMKAIEDKAIGEAKFREGIPPMPAEEPIAPPLPGMGAPAPTQNIFEQYREEIRRGR